jgi:hypothetical protein
LEKQESVAVLAEYCVLSGEYNGSVCCSNATEFLISSLSTGHPGHFVAYGHLIVFNIANVKTLVATPTKNAPNRCVIRPAW